MKNSKRKPTASIGKWKEEGKALWRAELHLRDREFSHQWAIADWMRRGEDTFGKERARDAAQQATKMTRETLQQFAHTARKVLIRVKGVSFGHHRLVARFKGSDTERKKLQKSWLLRARKNDWSVVEFDLHLKQFFLKDQKPMRTAALAASSLVRGCGSLISHWGFKTLSEIDSPGEEQRRELIRTLTETAEALLKKAENLKASWNDVDAYKALQRSKAATASAGSGQ